MTVRISRPGIAHANQIAVHEEAGIPLLPAGNGMQSPEGAMLSGFSGTLVPISTNLKYRIRKAKGFTSGAFHCIFSASDVRTISELFKEHRHDLGPLNKIHSVLLQYNLSDEARSLAVLL